MNSQNFFEKINSTGAQFLLFKALSDCFCFKKDGDIFEQIPLPTCKKCFGSGLTRKIILTEKIRYTLELQEKKEENFATLYFNSVFKISTKDVIAFLETDHENEVLKPLKPTYFCKVVFVKPFQAEKLKFYEVIVKKIDFLPYNEVIELG